jgi:DNA polymerase-3 subunit delta
VAEVAGGRLRAGYVLAGDEIFFLERCRRALIDAVVPEGLRDFCLSEMDLGETSIFEVLDRARTPSLMSPFQLVFVRGLKALYTRGAKKDEFAAIDSYFRSPNPQAVVVFLADHLHLPSDLRRMDMEDRTRFDRIRETLGDWCGMVELARADEADTVRWLHAEAGKRGVKIEDAAARELADALGSDMMLVASELEKLLLYVTAPVSGLTAVAAAATPEIAPGPPPAMTPAATPAVTPTILLGDVETMVLGAKQRSVYELTDAISLKDKGRALLLLDGLLNASDGGEDSAIGHLYMLARTFRQMLVILEKNVRDSRAIWQALWQGFRMPPSAADDLIRQARRYTSRRDLLRAIRLIARADLELRSSPPDKKLVLERLVLELASEPKRQPRLADLQHALDLS